MATFTYQFPDGTPVANGYIEITVSTDVLANGTISYTAGRVTKLALDANGQINDPITYPASGLQPSTAGAVYLISAYTAQGERVSGPTVVTS